MAVHQIQCGTMDSDPSSYHDTWDILGCYRAAACSLLIKPWGCVSTSSMFYMAIFPIPRWPSPALTAPKRPSLLKKVLCIVLTATSAPFERFLLLFLPAVVTAQPRLDWHGRHLLQQTLAHVDQLRRVPSRASLAHQSCRSGASLCPVKPAWLGPSHKLLGLPEDF